jgi:hypothetical protein
MQEEINDCNAVIALLDSVENYRLLSARESRLRVSLKGLAILLKQNLAYWKHRGKIKWVTLGDSNSKFFHSMATIQKRKIVLLLFGLLMVLRFTPMKERLLCFRFL